MAATNSCTLEKAPRRKRYVVSWLNQLSTRLSHEAPVGVKCSWKYLLASSVKLATMPILKIVTQESSANSDQSTGHNTDQAYDCDAERRGRSDPRRDVRDKHHEIMFTHPWTTRSPLGVPVLPFCRRP